MSATGRKAEQTAATRAALIAAARELFAQRGYGAVGTEEIVRAARVTRGALYHHFAGKEDLFRAVFEEIEAELAQQLGAVAAGASDPFEALRLGAGAFLDACNEPAVQRIVLIDAPSVLGWEQWREIGERYGVGLVQIALQAAMDAGAIERQPLRPLTHMLLGALDEAALYVARAEDQPKARREVRKTVERLLEGLRPRP
jgi:AcrR family transcriptional regulator